MNDCGSWSIYEVESFFKAWTPYGAWLKFIAATDEAAGDNANPRDFYTDRSITENYFEMRKEDIVLVGPKWLAEFFYA